MEAPLERLLWTAGFLAVSFFFFLARFGSVGCEVAPLLSLRGLIAAGLFLDIFFLATVAFFGEAFLGAIIFCLHY